MVDRQQILIVVGADPLARSGLALPGARPDLEALRSLARTVPTLALVPDADAASEALAAGARATLPRDAPRARLVAALRAAIEGLLVADASFAERLLRSRRVAEAPVEALTPRELEVMQLLSDGLSNKLIADRLGVSEHTAKFHVNSIMGKLGAQTRTDAVVRGARLGLVVL